MYHVSAQGVDERMINVHYYYYIKSFRGEIPRVHKSESPLPKVSIDQGLFFVVVVVAWNRSESTHFASFSPGLFRHRPKVLGPER